MGVRKKSGIPWKVLEPDYVAVHYWLNKNYTKQKSCERCGKMNKKLEWSANDPENYRRERDNYEVLCVSCHRKKDANHIECPNGHPRQGNTGIKNRGEKFCRICARQQNKEYRQRVKASGTG